MASDLTLRCSCGTVQGAAHGVAPATGNHVVCYCRDCQSFARFLGRAAEVLDAHGGTEIFQMSPANLSITAGAEHLACMRLSPKGLLRWYASCCNTPIGNTMPTSKLPFVGLIHLCIRKQPGGVLPDADLGPIQARAFRESAQGDVAAIPADRIALPLLVLRFVGLMLRWKLRGDGRRSVLFDAASGLPVVRPRVLTHAERAQLRSAHPVI